MTGTLNTANKNPGVNKISVYSSFMFLQDFFMVFTKEHIPEIDELIYKTRYANQSDKVHENPHASRFSCHTPVL